MFGDLQPSAYSLYAYMPVLSLESLNPEPLNPGSPILFGVIHLFFLMPVPFPLPEDYLYRRLVKP